MVDPQQVLVENYRECLRQLQTYIVWGVGTALSLFILLFATPTSGKESSTVSLPILVGTVTPGLAFVILLATYLVVGLMATMWPNAPRELLRHCNRTENCLRRLAHFQAL